MRKIIKQPMNMNVNKQAMVRSILNLCVPLCLFLGLFQFVEAASLSVSPSTGVYQSGATFSVRVLVNTEGEAVNAADATLTFNPRELSVVSVNRLGSIFNLWVTEPSFSNSNGTISFSGGLPSGYTGSAGSVMNITFRAIGSGPAKVTFSNGSVLANDGRGTNVLTNMSGGTYTVQTPSESPEPEVIEYVAPKNTPAAPTITSDTHPDPQGWSNQTTAELSWELPNDVTAVRTLLNDSVSAVPTKVYDTPITSISLEDLPEGESYFHIQFQNSDGWGRVTSYRLAVDTSDPYDFVISQPDDVDATKPQQTIQFSVSDDLSKVRRFRIKIDNDEPYEVTTSSSTNIVQLPVLEPGYHTIIVEAFDEAGNSVIDSYSFTIDAFAPPEFTDYPSQINEEVIPVITGSTRPGAVVTIVLQKVGSQPVEYTVTADEEGVFTYIPEGRFTEGVYELSAVAVDTEGAVSLRSEVVKIAVQQPGYIRLGGVVVSILSVLLPLVALLLIGVFGLWYLWHYFTRFRSTVTKESKEALDILNREFGALQTTLREHETKLKESRKSNKLTKAESEMIEAIDRALQTSQRSVEKEIEDVREIK